MAFSKVTKKPLRNFLIIPSITIAGIIFITWLVTPVVARYYLSDYFKSQGETASLDHLSVDFFPPKITAKDLIVSKDKQDTLTLKELVLGIKVSPLFVGTVDISHAKIDGLMLDIKQQKDDWIVAGINLSQFQSKEEEPQTKDTQKDKEKSIPWTIKLPEFAFTNSQIHLSRQVSDNSQAQKDTIAIDNFSVDGLIGKGLDWRGSIALKTSVNAANIDLASDFEYSPTNGKASLTLNNTVLPIQAFAHFIPAPYQTGTGTFSLDGKLTANLQVKDGISSYVLSKSSLTATLDKLNLALPEQNTVSVGSSTLAFSDLSASYDSQNNISTKGDVDFQINGLTAQLKDKQKVDLASSKLTLSDIEASYNHEKALSAKGNIALKADNLKAMLSDKQTASFATLSFDTPFEVAQDPQGLTAKTPETNLEVGQLALALSSINLTNTRSRLTLNNVNITKAPNNTITGSIESQLNSENVSAEQSDIKSHYDTLEFANKTAFSKAQNGDLNLSNSNIKIALDGFTAQQENKADIDLRKAIFTGDTLNVVMKDKQDPIVTGKQLNLTTQQFDAKLSDSKRAASWDSASVSDVQLEQQGKRFNIDLGKLNIAKLVVSKPIKKAQPIPALATIDDLTVNQVQANQDGVHIKSINTKDVTGNLLLDSKKRIKNLVFVDVEKQNAPQPKAQPINVPKQRDIPAKTAASNTDKAKSQSTDSSFKAPYYVILDAYDMTGNSSLYIQDNSIDPALNRTLTIEKFALRNLNTKDKSQRATLDFKAKNDKYSTISGKVGILPLANKLTMTADLIVSQAELPPYSPYIANVLGYQIDSGQLNLDLKLTSKKGVLSGTSHIELKQFDLGGTHQSSSVIKAGVVPLNIAVSALKDGNGNIDLDIPLSGNIDNPQFGWGDFLFLPIKKALFKASTSYLLQTFVPYANVISVAQFAGDQLLKIRVEPLVFKAEQTNLSDDQDTFLKQLTALMKDKKDSELKACGIASYQDLGLEKPPANIDNAARQKANDIASKRAQSLKEYLVDQKINSSRIFICAPAVDLTRNSQPRIELTF